MISDADTIDGSPSIHASKWFCRHDTIERLPVEVGTRHLLAEATGEPLVDRLGVHIYLVASGAIDAPTRLPRVLPFLRSTRSSWIFSWSFITP